MNKRVTQLLCLVMALTLVSCGGGTADPFETTPSDTTADPVETEETDGLPDTKMDGFEFSINHFNKSWLSWATLDLEATEENGDLVNDAIYRRNRSIEERFDCKININEVDRIGGNEIQAEVMAGDSNYDVWFSYDLWTLGAAQYLMDWNELPHLSLDREWWNPLATEVFNVGGKQYAASGNFSLAVLSRASGFIMNKDVYNTLNSDVDIYKEAADGTWTIDKMASVAKLAYSDLNGDGNINSGDRFGVVGSWKETFNRFILGAGVSYISKDKDGYPVFDLPGNENAINKLIKIYDTFMQDEIYKGNLSDNVDGSGGTGSFDDGEALFQADNLMGLESKRKLEIDIGFIPCPKYDESQERYYAPSFGAEIAVLLKTLPEERFDNVGIILEALAFDSQKNLIPTYKEVVLKTKSARDDESAAMIDIIVDSISFEFGLNAWQDTVANPLVRQTYAAGNPNFASTLASMQTSVNTAIEKLRTTLAE